VNTADDARELVVAIRPSAGLVPRSLGGHKNPDRTTPSLANTSHAEHHHHVGAMATGEHSETRMRNRGASMSW
jgi:hypothetical protein